MLRLKTRVESFCLFCRRFPSVLSLDEEEKKWQQKC